MSACRKSEEDKWSFMNMKIQKKFLNMIWTYANYQFHFDYLNFPCFCTKFWKDTNCKNSQGLSSWLYVNCNNKLERTKKIEILTKTFHGHMGLKLIITQPVKAFGWNNAMRYKEASPKLETVYIYVAQHEEIRTSFKNTDPSSFMYHRNLCSMNDVKNIITMCTAQNPMLS